MKTVLASLAIFAVALGKSSWDKELTTSEFRTLDAKKEFFNWAKEFGRNYENAEEEAYRYGIWYENMEVISNHNDKGLSYKFRANQFTDLTAEQFKIRIHGHSGSCLNKPILEDLVKPTDDFSPDIEAPTSVDWQAQGDVTPVKNQGQCGSCWAFASTGSIECDYSIKKGTLNSLSEQQLVDCTRSYGNYGCNGGWWYNAFDYVKQEGGLCSETEYPYTARDGTCRDKTCGTKYDPITGDVKVTPDSDTALGNAVAIGCVAVGVEADQTAWQHYSSGVLTGSCGTNIDHGVLAVGYGTSGSQEYWKVKNSWGTSWGDKGYIYVCRNCNKNGNKGECGINMYPYYVTV